MLKQQKARKFFAFTSVEKAVEKLKANLEINSPVYVYTLPGNRATNLIKIFAPVISEYPLRADIVDITSQVAYILDESINTDCFAIPINACNTHTIQRLSKVLYGDETNLTVRKDVTDF